VDVCAEPGPGHFFVEPHAASLPHPPTADHHAFLNAARTSLTPSLSPDGIHAMGSMR
jgi:hypothetical protein